MRGKFQILLIATCLTTLLCGAHTAAASERCDTTYVNSLDVPIVAVRALYDTPYDEPRPSSSQIILPPGGEYRIGIQGVTLPTRITLYLPLASFDFTDLSGLAPERTMRLEVTCEDGVPLLKRLDDDAGRSIRGQAQRYLTPENRPFALNRDTLRKVTTLEDLKKIMADTVKKQRKDEGDPDLTNILFTDTFFSRTTLSFPLVWPLEREGYASAVAADPDDPDAGLVIAANIPMPAGIKAVPILAAVFTDLQAEGYRPALFQLSANPGLQDKDLNFLEGNSDKQTDFATVQAHLTESLAEDSLREADIILTKDEAFDTAKKDEDSPAGPSVRILLANNQCLVIFLP